VISPAWQLRWTATTGQLQLDSYNLTVYGSQAASPSPFSYTSDGISLALGTANA